MEAVAPPVVGDGRVVLVTGASRGLGSVLVRELVGAGFRVACLARPSRELTDLCDELGDASLAVPADLTSPGDVADAVARIVQHFGRLDVVVNNAAFFEPAYLESVSDDVARRHVEVNLMGPVWCVRSAIPQLRDNGGHVVFVSSESVQRPFPMLSLYAATKAAVEVLSAALRDELRSDGIRVTTLRVGTFRGGTGSTSWPAGVRESFLERIRASGHVTFAGGQAEASSYAAALIGALELPSDVNADLIEVRSTLA